MHGRTTGYISEFLEKTNATPTPLVEPALMDQIKYIQYTQDNSIGRLWCENLDKPYIEVSFSKNQFLQDHSLALSDQLKKYGVCDFTEEQIAHIKNIIDQEFSPYSIEIRYAAQQQTIESSANTNMLYIVCLNATAKEMTEAGRYEVSTISGLSADFSCSKYKIIAFPKADEDDPLYVKTYTDLHELLHALGAGKHFRQVSWTDPAPFITAKPGTVGALDCKQTVMAYRKDCKQLTEAAAKEGFAAIESLPFFSDDLKQQTVLRRIFDNVPTHLGILDRELLKLAKQDFLARNAKKRQAAKVIQPHTETTDKRHVHEDLIVDPTPKLDWLDKTLIFFGKKLKELTRDCPSYFITNNEGNIQPYHSGNPLLLYGSTFNATATVVPRLGYVPTLQINKS